MSLPLIVDQLRAELHAIDAQRDKVLGALTLLDDTAPEPVVPARLPEGAPVVAPKPSKPKAPATAKRVQNLKPCPNGCGLKTNGAGMLKHLGGTKCPNRAIEAPAAVAPPEHGTMHRALECETCGHQEYRLVDLARHTDTEHRRRLTVAEREPLIIVAEAS